MDSRQSLRQKLDTLFRKIDLLQVQAGHISTGPGKALNVAKRYRIIIYCNHHNRLARRRGDGGCHGGLVVCEYDVDFSTDELLNCPRTASGLLFRVDKIQAKILAFDISKLV